MVRGYKRTNLLNWFNNYISRIWGRSVSKRALELENIVVLINIQYLVGYNSLKHELQ